MAPPAPLTKIHWSHSRLKQSSIGIITANRRSEEAQRIYANVDPEERQAAAKALVALVEKAS
jgi:hypothetical protein